LRVSHSRAARAPGRGSDPRVEVHRRQSAAFTRKKRKPLGVPSMRSITRFGRRSDIDAFRETRARARDGRRSSLPRPREIVCECSRSGSRLVRPDDEEVGNARVATVQDLPLRRQSRRRPEARGVSSIEPERRRYSVPTSKPRRKTMRSRSCGNGNPTLPVLVDGSPLASVLTRDALR